MDNKTLVSIVMGSDSDLPTMRPAIEALAEFDLRCDVRILSAHRTPDAMLAYGREAADRWVGVEIGGEGIALRAGSDGVFGFGLRNAAIRAHRGKRRKQRGAHARPAR